jgi:MerR family Zn(II)-responsive transcriptional regulator of zntA
VAKTRLSPELRSGEIARRAGVSADTLRHYERRGLLGTPRRLANGYRAYPPESLERVLLIQRALAVGFTLDELSDLLRARDGGHPPCREVRRLAERKLLEVDRQLEDLAEFRKALSGILRDWDGLLAKANDKTPARLLESLASNPEIRVSPMPAVAFNRRRKRKDRRS